VRPDLPIHDDLIAGLYLRRDQLGSKSGESVVTIALDGENPWESYQDQGVTFLRTLYHRLLQEPWLSPVTPSSFLARQSPSISLKQLHPGSWINGNFDIWIGHTDDHRAWDLLTHARRSLANASRVDHPRAEALQKSLETLYAAEGSDWTWWYGDDHSSGSDEIFDELYRAHIRAVYLAIGLTPPVEIDTPISSSNKSLSVIPQTRFISPVLDGRITHYFEWLGAGSYTPQIGALRAQSRSLKGLAFGKGHDGLYLRIDPEPAQWPIADGVLQLLFDGVSAPLEIALVLGVSTVRWAECSVSAAIGQCVELLIPMDEAQPRVAVVLRQGDKEIDRMPHVGSIILPTLTEDSIDPW